MWSSIKNIEQTIRNALMDVRGLHEKKLLMHMMSATSLEKVFFSYYKFEN